MTWALVASASATGTTAGINTTGATLLVAVGSGWAGNNGISDSRGNTWIGLADVGDGGNAVRIWYCVNPSVGTGHTFAASYGYTSIAVEAWAGNAASPFDVQATGARTTSALPLYAGSVTPSQNDSLIIAGLSSGKDASAYSISDGLALQASVNGVNFGHYGVAIAHHVQTTATPVNPGWSWVFDPSPDGAAALAVFKPAGGGSAFSGGSSSLVDVYVSGAGRASISTGSAAAVTNATAVGAGGLAVGSGSQSTVTVTAVGSGFSSSNPAYTGGSGTNVVVSSVGAGRVAFSLGSSSSVLVSAFGAGYANPFGGAGSTVIVTAVGAGTKFEFGNPTGGSSSVVSITAQGAGLVAIYGGRSSSVSVTAQGGGLSSLMQAIGKRIKTAYKRVTEASVIVYPVRTRKGWWFPKR